MRYRTVLLALTLLVVPVLRAQNTDVTNWIRTNAVKLTTVEARNGFVDMEPLRKIVGNARIVSLGEATHGTREFFQLKHRMLEFLATQMGFTIFSIEANMPEAYRLNDYVLTGRGDPRALLAGMYFWTWNTEEVLDMIHWMREFNASGKGRVQFTGFDMQTTRVASEIVRAYVSRTEPAYEPAVRQAAALAEMPATQGMAPFGVINATIPGADVAGKRVRVSGYIKTDQITDGYAGLWARADGETRPSLAFDNMQNTGPRGTTAWKHYQIELAVPAEARTMYVGALHPGGGTAWFADLKVEIDGKVYERLPFDLSTWPARGYTGGGLGYQLLRDPEEDFEGKPSLRIRRVSTPPPSTNPLGVRGDPAEAVARWQTIYDRLKAADTTSQEARWATQNARVVLQAMLSRVGRRTRDQSMADNVKWILDENPDAKIVLWAHNGHVAAEAPVRMGSYRPMGASLREMYGAQMVVFGFAFNQGSFQAIGGRLQDFTVPPNAPGTLDATLASAGIPIFALDVRGTPPGDIGAWLRGSHASRWIGAVYSAETPERFVANVTPSRSFDAILFVDRTTAARANR